MRIFLLIVFLIAFPISNCDDDDNGAGKSDEQKVDDALAEASTIVAERIKKEKHLSANSSRTSHRASNDSANLQVSAQVFEEATKIMVKKYGVEFLSIANEILETKKVPEETEYSAEPGREKRSARIRFKLLLEQCAAPTISHKCKYEKYSKYRQITGYCNNLNHPKWANGVTPIRRLLGTAFYEDGIQKMRSKSVSSGNDLPSTRLISNKLHEEGVGPDRRLSPDTNHLHMQIGQFVAHDITFTPPSAGKNGAFLDCSSCSSDTTVSPDCIPIPVPIDDKYFKKGCLSCTRALNGQSGFGVRTQINQNTHFLDLSAVYGSAEAEAEALRTFEGGKMRVFEEDGYTLPPQDPNYSGCQSKAPYNCFKCGDFRGSLHPALIPLHTIFLKEHNRITDKIRENSIGRTLSDEQTYQLARKIMIGMWQHIVYSEYLKKLLSEENRVDFDLVPLERGFYKNYNPEQNPSLSAEFSGAAFRFGHSSVRSDFPRQTPQNASIGSYDLGSNIFYADQDYLKNIGGWESILNGLMKKPAEVIDRFFTFAIRNQMFETRGESGSGVDLVSVNIMRGRDLGLHPYVAYRSMVGLPEVNDWNDLSTTHTQESIDLLKSVYEDPADIDLYTAIVMEIPSNGGQLGPTASYIVSEQFRALKTGDRFFYENHVRGTRGFGIDELNEIRKSTLGKIMCVNSKICSDVNENIFDLNSPTVACSSLPELNIDVFIK